MSTEALAKGKSSFFEVLAREMRQEIYGRGAQAYVSRGGELLLDIAIGYSTEPDLMRKHTLHNPWCAAKPVGAMAIGLMAERGSIDLDSPIGEQFSDTHKFKNAKFSPRDILNHNANLGEPRLHVAWQWPEEIVDGMVCDSVEAGMPNQPTYSEYTGWIIFDAFIEESTGKSAKDFIQDEVLKPQQLENDIYVRMTKDELAENYANIGSIYFGLPMSKSPCLSYRGEEVACAENRLGSFALVSMHGMGRFYENILKVLKGKPIEGLPSPDTLQNLVENNRGSAFDKMIGSNIDFAGGFMKEMKSLGFPRLSDASFGYSAMSGTIFMFADPEKDLSAAVLLNGTGRGPQDVNYLFNTLTNAILSDYEGLGSAIEINGMTFEN